MAYEFRTNYQSLVFWVVYCRSLFVLLRTTSIKQLLKLPYQNYQFKSKVPFDLIDINIFNVSLKYIRQHFLGGSSIVFDYHLPVRASAISIPLTLKNDTIRYWGIQRVLSFLVNNYVFMDTYMTKDQCEK
jgi:hypothetical protein